MVTPRSSFSADTLTTSALPPRSFGMRVNTRSATRSTSAWGASAVVTSSADEAAVTTGALLPGIGVGGQRERRQPGTCLAQPLEGGAVIGSSRRPVWAASCCKRRGRRRGGDEQGVDLAASQAGNRGVGPSPRASARSAGFRPCAASTARASNRVPEAGVPMSTRRPRSSATS